MRGSVITVKGPINPDEVGPALMHEHLFMNLNPPKFRAIDPSEPEIDLCNCWKIGTFAQPSKRNLHLDNKDVAEREVADLYKAGGRTLVELTVGGLAPRPRDLLDISEKTNVHIVMGCGHYVEEFQDQRNHERSVEDFAAEMIDQVTKGAWGTDICAGIIGEIGCQNPWTDLERRMLHGALLAQAETGAALNIHPGRRTDQPLEVVTFAQKLGHSVDRLIVSHIDRTIFDAKNLLTLADTGCVIEFDLFGWETSAYPFNDIDMPNDAMRLKWIRLLIENGHLDRILISHDICSRTRLTHYGGHGYEHIFRNVVPLMRRRGFSESELDAILVRNPKRLLTLI